MEKGRSLLDKMKGYKYSSSNMKDAIFKTFHNDMIGIGNFYSSENNKGVCHQQTLSFERENKGMNLIKVKGREPRYFHSKGSSHYYLIKPEGNLPNDFNYLSCEGKVDALVNVNSRVVDPSFKVDELLSTSDYVIDEFTNNLPEGHGAIFKNREYRPLIMLDNSRLLHVGMLDGNFGLFLQEEGKMLNNSGIPLEKLSQISNIVKGNPSAVEIVSNLNRAYVDFKFPCGRR